VTLNFSKTATHAIRMMLGEKQLRFGGAQRRRLALTARSLCHAKGLRGRLIAAPTEVAVPSRGWRDSADF